MSAHGHGHTHAGGSEETVLGKAYDARIVKRLWRYVQPYRRLVVLSVAVLFVIAGVQLVQPYLIKIAIDDSIREGRLDGLALIAVLYMATLLAEFTLRFAQLYVLERTGQNVVLDLRMHVFSHLQSLSSSFFDRGCLTI